MIAIISMSSIVLFIVVFVGYKLWSAKRTVEHLLKVNATLEQANQKQSEQIRQKGAELKNAQIKRNNDEAVKRASGNTIDDQLHAKGYLRDDSVGVSGVQPDLSKPCGHDGNEASGACSQSDL